MGGDEAERQDCETERSLQVELEISPADRCPVATMRDVREVHQRIGDDVCRTDVLVEDDAVGARVAHFVTELGPTCSCPVFDAFDCVPQIRETDGGFRIRTFVADREMLTALVAALRDAGGTVRLRRISEMPTVDGDGETVRVSLDALTEIQRETLRTAVASGYYATPRGTSLDALADEFGVSKSAVSRRLHAAENKLVGELFPCPN